MTAPLSNVIVTNESKSKRSIVKKHLSQKRSVDENKSRSTEEDESECSNKKQKDAENEVACDCDELF